VKLANGGRGRHYVEKAMVMGKQKSESIAWLAETLPEYEPEFLHLDGRN